MSKAAFEYGPLDQHRRSPSVYASSQLINHGEDAPFRRLSQRQQGDLSPLHDENSATSDEQASTVCQNQLHEEADDIQRAGQESHENAQVQYINSSIRSPDSTSNSYARASSTDNSHTLVRFSRELDKIWENQHEVTSPKAMAPAENNKHAADASDDYTSRVAPSKPVSTHSRSESEHFMKMNIDSDQLNTHTLDGTTSTLPPMETHVFRVDNGMTRPPNKRQKKVRLHCEDIAKMRQIGACEKCRARKIRVRMC